MKLRRVEIQAFRAYDKVGDSTFDFILPNGESADFVTIYAPNGFGKTSFYDAVEWGMTNNIHRFTRQKHIKDYAHDEKQLKFELEDQKSPHYILRNKHSNAEIASFVKLHLDSQEPIIRNLEHELRKNGSDYFFEEKDTTNHYFRDVILSQDNIDAFLREDDPQKRYTKFMEFFGDKELDRYYNNILILLRANDTNISFLKGQIAELQNSQQANIDNEILEKVNAAIRELIDRGEEFEIITPHYTDKDFLRFSDTISQRIFQLSQETESLHLRLAEVENCKFRAKDVYEKNKSTESDSTQLKELRKTLSQFEELRTLQNEVDNIIEYLPILTNQLQYSRELISKFSKFQQVTKTLYDKQQEVTNILNDINRVEIEIRNHEKELSVLKSRIDQSNKDYINTTSKLTELPALKQTAQILKSNIQANGTLVAQTEASMNQTVAQKIELENTQNAVENLISRIAQNDFFIELLLDDEIGQLFQKVRDLLELLQTHNLKLTDVNNQIAANSSLNNDIKKLVVLGTNIVNKTKSESCPLCSHEFPSFEALSKSLLQNEILDKQIQVLFETKNSLNNSISDTTGSIAILKNEILALKDEKLQNLKFQIIQIDQKLTLLKLEKEKLQALTAQDKSKLQEITASVGGDNFEELENDLSKLKDKIKRALDLTIGAYNTKLEGRNGLINNLDSTKINLRLAESEIFKLKSSPDYSFILSFVESLNSEIMVDEKYFSELLLANQKVLDENNNRLATIRTQIETIRKSLLKFNENTLLESINQLRLAITANKENFQNLLNSISKEFGLNVPGSSTNAEIELLLNNLSKSLRADILDKQNKVDNMSLIERYKSNVIPFLKFKEVEDKINQLTSELNFKTSSVRRALNQEKEMLSKFINQQIESFFFEDLINKLYRKIDPHPEYKSIKFRCDFDEGKPKLNVYVVSGSSTNLIPNLYFSTAQMNILSLSIFLAKALNAKDDKGQAIECIFIDDPIQSMDSINILSTIDLLRSLVVNFKKQVVLSTHDDNFYHLLQKKIPPQYFSAKYIELSTFGKVSYQSDPANDFS